jgi:predicted CxxxxCH...CXXCH cytochrome family protein
VVNGCDQITVSAPFTGDDNGTSRTDVERQEGCSGGWVLICDDLAGASPRTCVDNGLTGDTDYCYRVTFTDSTDTVLGTNPQTIGAFHTSVCAANDTTISSHEATATSCNQIMVTSYFSGDADDDGSTKVEYLDGSWKTACAAAAGASPRQCLIPELNESTGYDLRITYSDPDGVTGTNPDISLTGITTKACGTDTTPPMVMVLAPVRDAVIGGTDKVKVQVFDAGGLFATDPVKWSVDGAAVTNVATENANYDCGTNCWVYELDLNTTGYSDGSHYLTIEATDAEPAPSTNVTTVRWPIQVKNLGGVAAGSGLLLRRTHGAQLCIDCHNLKTHSSQATDAGYGSWAIDCLVCHTPHRTRNIYLVRETIRTPNSGDRQVRFESTAGAVADSSVAGTASYANEDNATQRDGICQVCHTRTKNVSGDARWQNAAAGGNVDSHYDSSGSSRCTGCHTHQDGFSGAGGACDSCHDLPYTIGKHGSHDQVQAGPGGWSDTTATTTATQYGFACAKCHAGPASAGHMSDGSKPHTVDISFDTSADPKNPSGSYAPDGGSQVSDPGANGDGYYWSDGTCDNLYCHSNAAPLGGSIAYQSPAPTWNQAGSLTCTSCHDTGGGGTTLSSAHKIHTGTYGYVCERCHDFTVDNLGAVDVKTYHVNGAKDVKFDPVGVNNSSGSYSGTVSAPNYTCSNTYCHSDGTDQTPAYTSGPSIAWNTTKACDVCHDGAAADDPDHMQTNAHAAHIHNATTIGSNYDCDTCHSDTVTGSGTISTIANHVNGSTEVTLASGTWTKPNCDNNYCHSSGADSSGGTSYETYSPNWTSTTLNCKGCHGNHSEAAFVSTAAGEPNYDNDTGPGGADANSHSKHVSVITDCNKCHSATTVTGAAIINGATTHTNGTRDVVIAGAYDTNGGDGTDNYNPLTKTCSGISCHGAGSPVWGGNPITCLGCHGTSGAEQDDFGASFWSNGTTATINETEWGYSGHGKSSGSYDVTGNPAAAFSTAPTAGTSECRYCHDETVNHGTAINPYRLRNTGGGDGMNGNCLACHKTGATGVTPSGQANENATTAETNAAHDGSKHGTASLGGKFCWDCHDPHGDRPSNTNSNGYNIAMIRSQVFAVQDGTYGYLGASGVARNVEFYNKTAPGDPAAIGRIAETTTSLGNNHLGICQACHGDTNESDWTKYWERTGYDDPDGPPSGNRYASGDTGATHHNTGAYCISCHPHDDKFKGSGGCKGCHADRTGSIPRAAVVGGTAGSEGDDFIRASRHVSDGTTTNEIVTDFDCILCHAEGDVTSAGTNVKSVAANHGNDGGSTAVELRDVDSAGGTGVAAVWPGKRLAAFTASTAQRDDMDSFCMSCHDSDGAAGVVVNKSAIADGMIIGPTGAQALDPFNADDTFQNANEIADLDTWRASNARVIDVKSQFNSTNQTGKSWASHHNLNQFTKRYTTRNTSAWPDAAWTTYTTKEGDNIRTTGETTGLHCSDCHLNESNAHGTRNTWYMLSDSSGNDTLFADAGYTGATDICVKCHAASSYGMGNTSTASRVTGHNSSGARCNKIGADEKDGFAQLGYISGTGGTTQDQLPCLGCHGGVEPGMIHGTNLTYRAYDPSGGDSGTFVPRYRFMGTGGSMRWYSPDHLHSPTDADWEGTAQPGCYTIGSADTWGSCDQHGGGKTDGGFVANRSRPLQY